MEQTMQRYEPGMLFGVTHALNGSPIVREPKLVKVSIGAPKGRAIMALIEPSGKWGVVVGTGKDKKIHRANTREEAEKLYAQLLPSAPEARYPSKLPFFTFTRPNSEGFFEPDWAAIEAHGPMPTELDVVFLTDEPFQGEYAMWSAAELKCRGNGKDAMRVFSLAKTDEEKALATQAKAAGSKFFPIWDGCATANCPYSKPEVKGDKEYPPPCKPSGDLRFQLISCLRVGGTSYLHTTGYRSISQLFSAIFRFKALTGGYLTGIPFKLCMRPYKTNHNGQSATQYGLSLEFRADSIDALRKHMIEEAFNFRRAMLPPVLPTMIAASADPIGDDTDDEIPETVQAAAMAAEFYPNADDATADDSEPATTPTPSTVVAAKTETATEKLKEKLAGRKAQAEAPAAAAPAPTPTPAPASAHPAQPIDDGWLS